MKLKVLLLAGFLIVGFFVSLASAGEEGGIVAYVTDVEGVKTKIYDFVWRETRCARQYGICYKYYPPVKEIEFYVGETELSIDLDKVSVVELDCESEKIKLTLVNGEVIEGNDYYCGNEWIEGKANFGGIWTNVTIHLDDVKKIEFVRDEWQASQTQETTTPESSPAETPPAPAHTETSTPTAPSTTTTQPSEIPTPIETPGFELVFAIAALLVSILAIRRW